jgi:hypothetical protein
MFHRLFQNIRLDRRSLFHAMRFAKLSMCLCAVKRLPGHLRDLAGESLDGSTARVIPLIATSLVAPSMRVTAGLAGALYSAMILLVTLCYMIEYEIGHNILSTSIAADAARKQIKLNNPQLSNRTAAVVNVLPDMAKLNDLKRVTKIGCRPN